MDLPSIITPSPDGYVSSSVEPLCVDKDPDAIKLFVGQVPKTFEEKDLNPYLLPFGSIHELSILRDKLNMSHKGIVLVAQGGPALSEGVGVWQYISNIIIMLHIWGASCLNLYFGDVYFWSHED